MTSATLLIEVRLLADRWHGVGDWPPSPFRLFQALVAGAYGGRWVVEPCDEKDAAFSWLERLPPPRIAAPPRDQVRPITMFVPNNDLDAVGGDPRRVGEIRSSKTVAAARFDGPPCFLYAWALGEDTAYAEQICRLADRLHTFGRGVDAAFAHVEVVDEVTAGERLRAHGGAIATPTATHGAGDLTPCPGEGSLASLKARHAQTISKFSSSGAGRKAVSLFRQPAKAHSRQIAYDRPPVRVVYALRPSADLRIYRPVPQKDARVLVEAVRDAAASRLIAAIPASGAQIERFLIGRGATSADAPRRVRIVPIPTLGHPSASPSIRRVVIETPPDCPLSIADLRWAFANLTVPGFDTSDRTTGEVSELRLAPLLKDTMLSRYGVGDSALRIPG